MSNNGMLVAALLLCAATSARADTKDPLSDSLSFGGVTLYGSIDIGYAYQSHGVPLSGQSPGGLEYQAFTTTRNFAGSVSTIAESGMEVGKIGLRIQQPIDNNWSVVGRLESGFNPLSGQLMDACASIAANGGVKQGQQTANTDSSRCGQLFNSQAYAGMGNPSFGQLTMGRHDSLMAEALGTYDPQARSLAFSVLGFSGSDPGAGSTEAQRWDNSARYAFQNNGFHLAALYSNGGQDSGMLGTSYSGDLGIEIRGLSVDAVYASEKEVVNLRSAFNNAANPLSSPGLSAYVSDNTAYNLLGKYTFDLGQDKFALYGGYSHIEKEHAGYTSGEAQGGYPIDVAININSPLVLDVSWLGGRYVFGSGLNLALGFYRITQNSYTVGRGPSGTQGIGCSGSGTVCAGDFNEESFVVDYVFNRHYDLYAGVNHGEVTDGLAYGFPGTTVGTSGSESQTTLMFGGRVRF